MTEKLRQVTPWILAVSAIIVAVAALVVALRTSTGQNLMAAMTPSQAPASADAAPSGGTALEEQISALPEGDFAMEVGAGTLECMEHQNRAPSATYAGGGDADTGAILGMLRYYTVNAGKEFCDGRAATVADHAWAQQYVDLGADPANVQTILDGAATG